MGFLISALLILVGVLDLKNKITPPTFVTDHLSRHDSGWICIILGIMGLLAYLIARDGGNRFGRPGRTRR
jgi:hypothetical protein